MLLLRCFWGIQSETVLSRLKVMNVTLGYKCKHELPYTQLDVFSNPDANRVTKKA